MSKCKSLLKALFTKGDVRGAYLRVAVITALVLIAGFILENFAILDGKFLSQFMREHFNNHSQGNGDFLYFLYYIILYATLVLYMSFALHICVTKHEASWYALVIAISVIFAVFSNAYLTLTLQYSLSMNSTHLTSFMGVATILSGVAGIRMSLLKKEDGDKEEDKK